MSNIISSKKLEANRRNALKSTGPKTKEGKLFASQNALKHGLNAEKFLVIGENLEEVNLFIERKDISIFVIHMSQLIKIGLGVHK